MNGRQGMFTAFSIGVVLILLGAGIHSSYLAESAEVGKVKVVATFYPLVFFADYIGGERVVVRTLVPGNTEVHAWSPSISDILEADEADVLLYNGAGLDPWFEDDLLGLLLNDDDIVVVETTHGIELDEPDVNGTHDGHDHGSGDPHTWISPFLARQQAARVYGALLEADPAGELYYTERWLRLESKLAELDLAYKDGLENTTHDTIIVNHGAFGHLAERYGFEQHGVIGLSADEQPSTSAMIELIDEMEELGLDVLFVDPVYSDDHIEMIKREVRERTGRSVRILKLYLMLGRTDGLDLIGQMERNLENLRAGLGSGV